MKTLQVVGDSKYGGATYLILEWCKYLLAHSCEVDVLSTDAVTVRALQEIPGVNVIGDIFIPREINPTVDLKAFAKLLKLFARKKYDVVHTYSATPSVLGRFAARLAGVPAIFHHQAGWAVNEFSSFGERLIYLPLEYFATMASTRGICVSYAEAKHAEEFHLAPLRKLFVIRNGIDPAPFLSKKGACVLRQAINVSADTLIVGSTGRLASIKDISTTIHAALMLRELLKEKSFVFVLIGDGPDRSALEAMVDELGLHDIVRFLGFRNDIPQLLNDVDVFVTTSLREGLSISLLEAMATARPIVATSIPPNAELIEHEATGLLVPPKSPKQVAQAIARFVHEPELAQKCASAARQRVLDCYTIDRMFRETWNLYNGLAE